MIIFLLNIMKLLTIIFPKPNFPPTAGQNERH